MTVFNVAPTATFTNSTGNVNEGQSVDIVFTDPYDPGSEDTTAGFLYSYDCTNDGAFELSDDLATSFTCTYLDNGTFTVLGRITDKDGGFTDYTIEVLVNNVAPIVGPITAPVDPTAVNLEISASAVFTDPGVLDTHTAVWSWGDGSTSPGLVTEADGSGTVTGEHAFTEAGVYAVELTVTDKDGDFGTSVYQFVVIYNPIGGFVTGSGWIDSPEGAYTPDPTLAGKARFGFVAKYQKGTNVPTGNTQFQFITAGLRFHSTDFDWLVIAGAQAKFKGTGTINGQGDYGFMITAIDGDINGGGGIDKFRIKIWDKVTGDIIYDNQIGESDDSSAATALSKGSIVIHK